MEPALEAEIVGAVSALQEQLEVLVVRGVRTASADDLKQLAVLHEELDRIGAVHLSGRIGELIARTRSGDGKAAAALCGAQTVLRVFDRVLTLHAARAQLGAPADEEGESHAAAPPPAVKLEDRAELLPMLAELAAAVESLIASGLSTASAATRQKLEISFKEASRRKLLRLGASLRYVNEELGRFLAESAAFSAKRFAFFLHRAWLLARGLHEAIREDDAASIARLLMAREPEVVARVEAIVLGVGKRVTPDGGCSFEFRMRSVGGAVPANTPLVWSCVFAAKQGVPPEAFLYLPQPQKFSPKVLLDGAVYAFTECAISRGEPGGATRILLGPKSTVTAGRDFADWDAHLATDWGAIGARAAAHRVSPLELDVELQELIALRDWQIGAPEARDGDRVAYPIAADGRQLVVIATRGAGDRDLIAALDELRGGAKPVAAGVAAPVKVRKSKAAATAPAAAKASKSKSKPAATRGPLFGLMHYERCQLVFQPLAMFGSDGPSHLMISRDKISIAGLVGSLDFR